MNNIINYLMKSPYSWFVLSLITVFSVVITIFIALKNRTIKRISYRFSSYGIIRNHNNELQYLTIKYKDNVINDLTISKISLWNSGNSIIEYNDLVTSIPLAVSGSEFCTILDCSILNTNEKSNLFEIVKVDNKILINFEYIDTNQGLIIQIIHTGTDLHVEGKIKGGESLKDITPDVFNSKFADKFISFSQRKGTLPIVLTPFLIMIIVIDLSILKILPYGFLGLYFIYPSRWDVIGVLLLNIFVLLTFIFTLRLIKKIYPKIPNDLY